MEKTNQNIAIISDALLEAVDYKNGDYWCQLWVSDDTDKIFKDYWYKRQVYVRVSDGNIVNTDWSWYDNEPRVKLDWIIDLFQSEDGYVLDMDDMQINTKVCYYKNEIYEDLL